MRLTRVRTLFWIGLAAAIALVFAAASGVFDTSLSRGLLAGAVVLALYTCLWYRTAARVAEKQEFEARQKQLADLKKQITLLGAKVEVRTSSGLLILALFAVLTFPVVIAALTSPSAKSITWAVLLTALTGIIGCGVIPFVGRPRLIISRDGVEAPILGCVRWDQIESIALREIRTRGVLVAHALDLLIPATRDFEHGLNWTQRILRRVTLRSTPPFVVVNLASPSIHAEVVRGLCSSLWSGASGRKNPEWSVLVREHVPEFQRLEKQLEKVTRAGQLVKSDPPAAMRMIDEMTREVPHPMPQVRRVSAREAELWRAFLERLQQVDPNDRAARGRATEDYIRELRRTTPLTWLITLLVVTGVVVAIAVSVR
jgi:hypothetical protein